jgi:stage III sporulation protein AD
MLNQKFILIIMDNFSIFSASLLLITIAVLCVTLKTYSKTYALVLSLITSVTLLIYIVVNIQPFMLNIERIIENIGLKNNYLTLVFKILGICILVQFISTSLRDSGETSLAFQVELVGKILIIYTSLPILLEFINLILDLTR